MSSAAIVIGASRVSLCMKHMLLCWFCCVIYILTGVHEVIATLSTDIFLQIFSNTKQKTEQKQSKNQLKKNLTEIHE